VLCGRGLAAGGLFYRWGDCGAHPGLGPGQRSQSGAARGRRTARTVIPRPRSTKWS